MHSPVPTRLPLRARYGTQTIPPAIRTRMIDTCCTAVADLRQWTPQGWEWRLPHPILPNSYIEDIIDKQPFRPQEPSSLARQGQCWKSNNKVIEITACYPDRVRVTTWVPLTSLTVFQLLSRSTTIEHTLPELMDQLGPSPVKVFLGKLQPNGSRQILAWHAQQCPLGVTAPNGNKQSSNT